ncbi:hypothetical protein D9M71_797440 [compost metagenome]
MGQAEGQVETRIAPVGNFAVEHYYVSAVGEDILRTEIAMHQGVATLGHALDDILDLLGQ